MVEERSVYGLADRFEAFGGHHGLNGHVPPVTNCYFQLESGDEIEGTESLQCAPQGVRGEIAASRGYRARLHRRAEQGDRGRRIVG